MGEAVSSDKPLSKSWEDKLMAKPDRAIQGLFNPDESEQFWKLLVRIRLAAKKKSIKT